MIETNTPPGASLQQPGSVIHFWRDIELIPVGTTVTHMGVRWTIDRLLKRHYLLRYDAPGVRGTCKWPYEKTMQLRAQIHTPNRY